MILSLTFTDYEWFPWIICNGCGMPAGNAYPSGRLVPSPILGLANAPIVETKFLELAMSLLDFSPRIPLGTFSILLLIPRIAFPRIGSFVCFLVPWVIIRIEIKMKCVELLSSNLPRVIDRSLSLRRSAAW